MPGRIRPLAARQSARARDHRRHRPKIRTGISSSKHLTHARGYPSHPVSIMKFEILNPKFLKLVQAGIGLLLVATLYSTAQEELGRRPRTDVTLLDTQETDQDRFWF